MKEKSPAFSLYANDWLGSQRIAVMSPEEEGAYIRLLCYAWGDPDCSLPDDDNILATLSRLGERWFNGCSTNVKRCFNEHPEKPGRIYNPRLLEERKKQQHRSLKAKESGVKSGESRRYSSNKRSTNVQPTLNFPASASAPISRSKDLLSDADLAQQKRRPRAGVFAKLTEADLKDPLRLQSWYERATKQRNPVIHPSVHHRLMVFSAAEQAFSGENPVGLFAWLVSGKRWDGITVACEEAAQAKLKQLDWTHDGQNGFEVDLQSFKKPEA